MIIIVLGLMLGIAQGGFQKKMIALSNNNVHPI
jgi:hypothetical protein